MITVKKITWDQVLPVWEEHLPNMSLETNSAMCLFLNYGTALSKSWEEPVYDLQNMEFTPTFWGAFYNDKLVGVNSGHMCIDKLYRSRGLFVFPEYRGFGIGQKLLMKTIAQAIHEKAIVCWSYPKNTAERSYHMQNFLSQGHSFNFQYEGDNIRAVRVLNQKKLETYLNLKE
jgi:GNAT superfamily N-acetyltransferase|tara:strand:+ start:478 stop:996 length:519 start_codon:yes stop_codon:yes gene_type:complete